MEYIPKTVIPLIASGAVMLYALQHCGLAHRSVKHRVYIPPPLLVAVFYLNGLYAIPKMERARIVTLLWGLFYVEVLINCWFLRSVK